jgi:hypothetical protein
MVRFELTASCSQSRRANQTTLHPGAKGSLMNYFFALGKNNHLSSQLHKKDFVWQNTSTHHDMLMCL